MPTITKFPLAVLGALFTVLVLIVLSQSHAKQEPARTNAGPAGPAYAGIPQDGISLGRPDAPLTMVEFADLQCPFCREYSVGVLPEIVDRYVRSGELRLELHVLRFLGPDSATAARGAAAAARQDGLWDYADLFYERQGAENSGYVTDEFVRDVAAGAGLKAEPFARAMAAPAAERMAMQAEKQAHHLGVQGTPSFFLGRTGGALAPVPVRALEFDEFASAIEAAR